MAKWLKIKIGCPNCPNQQWQAFPDRSYRTCAAMEPSRKIDVPITAFPDWCPLPDAPAKDGNPFGLGR